MSRPVRAFHVASWGDGKTGPLDHSARIVATRAEFRAALRHIELAPGQHKSTVGAWVPVDARTRAEGASSTTRKGLEYELETQVGRHLGNVTGSSASTMLDVDKLPREEWELLLERIAELGWSGEAWSTASYSASSDVVSARLHLHLDRELTSAEEVERVRRAISARLGGMADPACFQAVAVFYLPASRGDHFVEVFHGAEIVVDALPAVAAPRPTRATPPRPMAIGQVATAEDIELAREELSRHAIRIAFHPDEHIRDLCAKGKTYYLGQYIAAGALTEEETREVLETGVRAWADRMWPGENNEEEIERRLSQIFAEAITDGARRGAALPAERVSPKQEFALAAAEKVDRGVFRSADEIAREVAEMVSRGEAAIYALPPGVGKTRAALTQIAGSNQDAIVYAPSHALAEEHRQALLGMGMHPAEIAHEMSPLHRPAGGEEGCERSRASRPEGYPTDQPSPFASAVRAAHLNLRATVCPNCPKRDECPVRFPNPTRARVRLRVHSAYEPVEPGRALVFLDEEPETHDRLTVTRPQLRELTGKHSAVLGYLTGAQYAYWTPRQVAAEEDRRVAEAALAEEEVVPFDPGQAYYVRQAALALAAGRTVRDEILGGLRQYGGSVRLGAAVARELAENPGKGLPVAQEALDAVRAVLALATSPTGATARLDGSLEVISPTAAYRDVRRGWVTLLSATPTPGAYPGVRVYSPLAADGLLDGVVRNQVYLSRPGTQNFRMEGAAILAEVAERMDDLRRMHLRAGGLPVSGDRRVLVVTFKHVVERYGDELRAMWPGRSVELRWFGNVAGSNLFQEGGVLEVDTVVTVGDYYANRRWLFEHLAIERGYDEEDIEEFVRQSGVMQVAQELAQAHGRAREPRRTKPLWLIHFGRVTPLGWAGRFEGNGVVDQSAAKQALDEALRRWSMREVARRLGVTWQAVQQWRDGLRPIPEKYHFELLALVGAS